MDKIMTFLRTSTQISPEYDQELEQYLSGELSWEDLSKEMKDMKLGSSALQLQEEGIQLGKDLYSSLSEDQKQRTNQIQQIRRFFMLARALSYDLYGGILYGWQEESTLPKGWDLLELSMSERISSLLNYGISEKTRPYLVHYIGQLAEENKIPYTTMGTPKELILQIFTLLYTVEYEAFFQLTKSNHLISRFYAMCYLYAKDEEKHQNFLKPLALLVRAIVPYDDYYATLETRLKKDFPSLLTVFNPPVSPIVDFSFPDMSRIFNKIAFLTQYQNFYINTLVGALSDCMPDFYEEFFYGEKAFLASHSKKQNLEEMALLSHKAGFHMGQLCRFLSKNEKDIYQNRELIHRVAQENCFEMESLLEEPHYLQDVFLAQELWREGKGETLLPLMEKFCYQISILYFKEHGELTIPEMTVFIDWLRGKGTLDDFPIKKAKSYYVNPQIIACLYGYSTMAQRGIFVMVKGKQHHEFAQFTDMVAFLQEETMEGIWKTCEETGIMSWEIADLALNALWSGEEVAKNSFYQKFFKEILEHSPGQLTPLVKNKNYDIQIQLLREIYTLHPTHSPTFLLDSLGSKYKKVREVAKELLSTRQDLYPEVTLLLESPKEIVQDLAYQLISRWDGDALIKELEENQEENIEKIELFAEKNNSPQQNKKLEWLELETLSPVRWNFTQEPASTATLSYYLGTFITLSENAGSTLNDKICSMLSAEDLATLSGEIIERWEETGAEAKEKGALLFAAVHGDELILYQLGILLDSLAQQGRWQLVRDTMEAMAINRSPSLQTIMKELAETSPYSQVQKMAQQILEQSK